jgi:acetyl-CoA carboxylase biotin carboxyl carrier protein
MIPDLNGDQSGGVVSSPEEAIRRVVDAFERSDWSEIDVRWGNVRVHLSATAPEPGGSARVAGAVSPASPAHVQPATDDDDRSGSARSAATPPAGAHVVVSPSPGIFWRSPEPGLPPFADVGDDVDGATTVCIVEVMKLMNHVKAGAAGTVAAVLCDNGVAVRKGQSLFAIVPVGSSQ